MEFARAVRMALIAVLAGTALPALQVDAQQPMGPAPPPELAPYDDRLRDCFRALNEQTPAAVGIADALLTEPDLPRVAQLRATLCLGQAHGLLGNAELAEAAIARSLALTEQQPPLSPEELHMAQGNAAGTLLLIGQWQRAADMFEGIYEQAKRQNAVMAQVRALDQLAQVESVYLNQSEQAEAHLHEAIESAAASAQEVPHLYYNLGYVQFRAARYDEAMANFDLTLDRLARMPSMAPPLLTLQQRVQTHRAAVMLAQGQLDAARALLRQSIDAQVAMGDMPGKAVSLTYLADAELARGDAAAALAAAREAAALSSRGRFVIEQQDALGRLAAAQAASGLASEALETQRRAHAMEVERLRNQNLQGLAAMQARLDREREVRDGERDRRLRDLAIGALLVTLAFGAALLWMQSRLRRQRRDTRAGVALETTR